MRISDSTRSTTLLKYVTRMHQQLTDLQTKLGTGNNINTPSDDPVVFAANVQYNAELSTLDQYNSNLQGLSTLVSIYDTCFTGISAQLNTVEDLAYDFASMDISLQEAATDQIEAAIEQLVTIANTTNGSTYIFGGQQADSAPFRLNSDYSVTYTVDATAEDVTEIYVDKSQSAEYGISGRSAFYSTSKIVYGDVDNTYTGDAYSNTDNFVYVIETGTNDTINVDGTDLTLSSGVYTGAGLAKEIQDTLGSDYTVAFDSSTRKFVISNNTGSDVDFNWSASNAANTLGFDNVDTILASGNNLESDLDTGRKSFLIEITNGGTTTGATGRATYRYSTDGGTTWSGNLTVSTGGADTTAGDITIDSSNNTFVITDGTGQHTVELDQNTYTGSELAVEIQDELGTDYTVSYNAETRKFSITNNTGGAVTFNWSNANSTAAGVLGYENVDSVVRNGTSDTGDYDAGMFIDGSGVATVENSGIKLAFSTNTTDTLTAGDTFQVEDLSVFKLLTNLKNAFETGNTTWVSKNVRYLEDAQDLVTKSAAVVAFQGTQATTLADNNATRTANIEILQTDLVGADTTEIGVQLNVLLNTYQALLSTMSKVLSINILDYLN